MSTNQYQAESQDNLFDVKRILIKVLSKWYLLLISVGICIAVAYFLDKYTKPVFGLSTLLYVKDNDKANVSSILYGEETFGTSRSLSNQMIFLKSRALVEKTIQDLDFGVSYFIKGKFVTSELYKSSPIEVLVDTSSTYIPYYTDFSCAILSAGTFILDVEDKESWPSFTSKTLKFDELNEVEGFKFRVKLRYPVLEHGKNLIFRVNSMEGLTDYYKDIFYVSPLERDASVLKISFEEETPEKGKDFLNQLVYNFIENNLQEKNEIASRTVNFINQMLSQNKDSLAHIESKIERFKGSNTVVSVQEKGTLLVSELKQLEKEKASLLTTNQYFDLLENSLQNGEDGQLVIPAALGIEDATLNSIINELISLRLENKMLKADNKLKNPFIEVNNQKIDELKNTLKEKIKTQKTITTLSLANLNQRINTSYASQQRLPAAEREFKDISRNYAISETLVQFLMEKRAEAGIARASNISDYKMIDAARVESGPIKRKQFDYKIALLTGLAIPIVFIVLLDFLNNKISSKEDLLKFSQVPLLGVIVHGDKQNSLSNTKGIKSAFLESLRSVRSNLNYLSEHTGVSKTILITSSISGEGKSFCSKNIGHVLSLTGKRTLLIDADMRKLHSSEKDLGIKPGPGLSEYLSGMALLTDIVQPTHFEQFYLISPGNIPPNPSELLLGERMKQLLTELKTAFDYIIVDTPPIGIVSDALELMKQSDINLIVVREGYTEKPFLKYINDLYLNQKYKHMAFVYNDANLNKSTYGYGISKYGYGYYDDEKAKKGLMSKILKSKQ